VSGAEERGIERRTGVEVAALDLGGRELIEERAAWS
jgi:hypothetical protein